MFAGSVVSLLILKEAVPYIPRPTWRPSPRRPENARMVFSHRERDYFIFSAKGVDLPSFMASSGETAAHRELKRLAAEWARQRRLVLVGTEVRLPRSNYRADVAACTPRVLSSNAYTAVFECKATRSDFLCDAAPESLMQKKVAALYARISRLRDLIGQHRPDLRRGDELFPLFEAVDLRGLRHDTHSRLSTAFRVAQTKLYEATKFSRMTRWRSAALLYLVVEPGILELPEVPDGWGVLVREGSDLILQQKPVVNPTTIEERVAFLERVAAAPRPIYSPQTHPMGFKREGLPRQSAQI